VILQRIITIAAFLPLIASAIQAHNAAEEMRLTVGRSVVLDFADDIRQISTSDPAIVDAIAVSTREVLLHAKAVGTATVVIWPRTGDRTIQAITVEQNLDPLRQLLNPAKKSRIVPLNWRRRTERTSSAI
jgi:pilus assembly protein CpaC